MSKDTGLALLVEEEVATQPKMEELRKIWAVKNRVEAEKTLEALLINPEITLILTTNQVFEWVKPIVSAKMKNRQCPIVACIAGKKECREQADILVKIAKRIVRVKGLKHLEKKKSKTLARWSSPRR
ncbi:MAG: hypothetical protein QXO32_01055 [Candidatus Bathyarchaeia archaeon]